MEPMYWVSIQVLTNALHGNCVLVFASEVGRSRVVKFRDGFRRGVGMYGLFKGISVWMKRASKGFILVEPGAFSN